MSSYTMQLREYIESFSSPNLSLRDNIEIGRSKLFDFDYPIFDPAYKSVFETHFIRTFYMREIGFETEGLFKFNLETWLVINMPYYNKLFESELIEFDPLDNMKSDTHWTKTREGSGTSDSSGNMQDNSFDRGLDSNTPDTRLAITTENGEGVIEYASSIQENKSNSTKTSSGTSTSNMTETEDYILSRSGKIGVQSFSKMMNEYRDSLLRIEQKIFSEMQELFMLVY